MAAPTHSAAVKKPTYESQMNAAFAHRRELETIVTDLTTGMSNSLEAIATLAVTLDSTNLPSFLQRQYQNYHTLLKGHTVATEALTQYKKILASCSPTQVALNPERIAHLEGLGRDMSQYPEEEVTLATKCAELALVIQNLQQLVDKAKKYIDDLPPALDIPARHQRQSMRKTATYGDNIPDRLGGANGYFLKEFQHYCASPAKESSTTGEEKH